MQTEMLIDETLGDSSLNDVIDPTLSRELRSLKSLFSMSNQVKQIQTNVN